MHLLYIDDSGSVPDPSQAYFVWGGVSVFERQGYWISGELDKIASRFNPAEPHLVEFHGSEMLQGRGPWKGVPLADRIQAMMDALKVISLSHPSNCLFAAAVSKQAVQAQDPAEVAFEEICRRFDHYLMRLHRNGDTQRGIIISDKSTYEQSFQVLTSVYRRSGHSSGIVRNFAEVPLFIDSRASRLVQLADLIAYSVFRKFERNDERFFQIVESRFDNHGGVVHGLYHRG